MHEGHDGQAGGDGRLQGTREQAVDDDDIRRRLCGGAHGVGADPAVGIDRHRAPGADRQPGSGGRVSGAAVFIGLETETLGLDRGTLGFVAEKAGGAAASDQSACDRKGGRKVATGVDRDEERVDHWYSYRVGKVRRGSSGQGLSCGPAWLRGPGRGRAAAASSSRDRWRPRGGR